MRKVVYLAILAPRPPGAGASYTVDLLWCNLYSSLAGRITDPDLFTAAQGFRGPMLNLEIY